MKLKFTLCALVSLVSVCSVSTSFALAKDAAADEAEHVAKAQAETEKAHSMEAKGHGLRAGRQAKKAAKDEQKALADQNKAAAGK